MPLEPPLPIEVRTGVFEKIDFFYIGNPLDIQTIYPYNQFSE
jgi:hypothetical protein